MPQPATAEMIRVYRRGVYIGDVDEYDARVMISRQEARFDRGSKHGRRLILTSDAAEAKARSLSGRDACGGTVSPTYREDLYRGSRKEGTDIVTSRCFTLKKLQNGRLVHYGEGEGFARKRFNPDKLPTGLIPAARNHNIAASWQ
jgi:hypothetical protein